jgi:hypothetical protein
VNIHKAIYELYPQVTVIRGDEAFDADGNAVIYDSAAITAYLESQSYKAKRQAEYPPMADYLDAMVKNDQQAIDEYIATCKMVKAKYPKSAN